MKKWIATTALSLTLVTVAVNNSQALAEETTSQIGTLTQVEGTVKLFTHPSKALQKNDSPSPQVLFEGEYFRAQDAKVGDKVDLGNIVRTAPTAKARVIFDNGDQFNVGAGTAYRVSWSPEHPNAGTNISLMYGKFRGVIEKGGPRSKLKIRTRTATMGVRGTDFFIADEGDKGTEVSIIRGSVEVKPEAPQAKPVEVKAGYSVDVAPPAPVPAKSTTAENTPPPAVQPAIELRKTTQEDLTAIQKSSKIQPKKDEVAPPPEVQAKLAVLEKKAVETTLGDIKKHDPKLYAQLQAQPQLTSTDDINAHAVAEIAKTAPKAPEKHKPYKSEMDDLENNAYEQYFKNVE